MVAFGFSALFLTLQTLLFLSSVGSTPVPQSPDAAPAASSFWQSGVKRNGQVAFGDANHKVFRNVKDYGAKGDGSTDDTEAFNRAVKDGNRCGEGKCDSSTVTPALVYVPAGTYIISKPVIMYYYTQIIGDASNLPVLKAAASFEGMAVLDANPYLEGGNSWFTNQNNFFRQVRNLVIDLTGMPASKGAGIHWQVAQATSLQNIRFEMVKGGQDNKQQGIFMENGSGGFMTDLVFNGGNMGAFFGSQQFTMRNMTFNDCNTAIFLIWNWAWTFKSININRAKVGIDMASGGFNQTVGSVLLMDSKISDTQIGVNSSFNGESIPTSGGTLILDNVDCSTCKDTVMHYSGKPILAGGQKIKQWAQGAQFSGSSKERTAKDISINKPQALMKGDVVFERSKPQYQEFAADAFVSIKAAGAKGDGVSDDTAAIQEAIDKLQETQILYFDHGAYRVTKTIVVPAEKNIKITGEIWPLIMAEGAFFGDQNDPKPVFQIGKPGDVGGFEMSDIIIETIGPVPGAILMEWNMVGKTPGAAGLWDVHFRIGGTAGTKLQMDSCTKNPNVTHSANEKCMGAFMLMHLTEKASAYLENTWFWVADHELDQPGFSQIDIYNGRGVLIESQGPVWMYGTASEHSVLYNYQLNRAKNVFMSLIQTETPYMQGNPDATTPFTTQAKWNDPDFSKCTEAGCKKAWGLRSIDTSDFLLYGAGLYSFFENYDQKCAGENNCQANMLSIEGSAQGVEILALSTKASVSMLNRNGASLIKDIDNRSNFCGTIAVWKDDAAGANGGNGGYGSPAGPNSDAPRSPTASPSDSTASSTASSTSSSASSPTSSSASSPTSAVASSVISSPASTATSPSSSSPTTTTTASTGRPPVRPIVPGASASPVQQNPAYPQAPAQSPGATSSPAADCLAPHKLF